MDLRTGRCAILFPHGVLFREEEYALRKKIVDADLIDCVLGLGPNLFYNSTMEACVVFCKMNKPKHKKGRILFINAINEVALQKSQGFLENNHIQKIFNAYQSYCDIKSFSKVADLNSINRENFDLRVGVYVPIYKEVEVSEEKTLSKIINDWQESSMVLRKYVQNLYDALEEVGLRE
jgi:type I restriction enzyme M protein